MIDTPASPMTPSQGGPAPAPLIVASAPPPQATPVPTPPVPAPIGSGPAPPLPKKPFLPAWTVWLLIFWGVVLLGILGVYVYMRLSSPDTLAIQNQAIETSVHVQSLELSPPKGGFLVIYKLSNPDLFDSAVATSFYLFPGTYTNFSFPLKEGVDSASIAGTPLIGVLYEDVDESKHWEPRLDREVKTLFGKAVKSLFRDTAIPEVVQ